MTFLLLNFFITILLVGVSAILGMFIQRGLSLNPKFFVINVLVGFTALLSAVSVGYTSFSTVFLGYFLLGILALSRFFITSTNIDQPYFIDWKSFGENILRFSGFLLIITIKENLNFFYCFQALGGIDEPFYAQLSAAIEDKGIESASVFYSYFQSISNVSTIYHYFDIYTLSLYKIIFNGELRIDLFWYSYRPLVITLMLEGFYLTFLVSKVNKYLVALGVLLAFFYVPTIPFAKFGDEGSGFVLRNGIFVKFFIAPVFIFCLYGFSRTIINLAEFCLICLICFLVNPLFAIPAVVSVAYFLLINPGQIKHHFTTNKIIWMVLGAILITLLPSAIKYLNATSGVGVTGGAKPEVKDQGHYIRILYVAFRMYAVKAVYVLLFAIPIFYAVWKRKLWVFAGAIVLNTVVALLLVGGLLGYNRENWQFSSMWWEPLLLMLPVLGILITYKSRNWIYTVLLLVLLLFGLKNGVAVKLKPHTKNNRSQVENLERDFLHGKNKVNVVGFFLDFSTVKNEYEANSFYPFKGGIMSRISDNVVPVNLNRMLDSEIAKISLGLEKFNLKKAPINVFACEMKEDECIRSFIRKYNIQNIIAMTANKQFIDSVDSKILKHQFKMNYYENANFVLWTKKKVLDSQ